MSKVKNYCRDCGEPMEKNIDICLKCRDDRTKERERQYRA
jgi:predicted amidophosphoribosyltransferase